MLFVAGFAVALLAAFPSFILAAPHPSPVAQPAASGTLTGVLTATPASGGYHAPVTIDGVTYNLLVDTGSGALWIKGKGNGTRWHVSYGGGGVDGSLTSGTVTVAGMTLTNQSYGLADSFGSGGPSYDGILGLQPSLTQFNADTASWIANIVPKLQSPVLSVNLVRGGSSTFAFGTTQPQSANTTWAPTASSSQWRVNVSSFGVTPAQNDTSAVCFIDTGNTRTYVPMSVSNAYWHDVPNATTSDGGGKYWFPCSSQSSAADFRPVINGNTYDVPAWDEIVHWGSNCESGLQGRSSGCNLGQPFMWAYHTIFDYAKNQIGFVRK